MTKAMRLPGWEKRLSAVIAREAKADDYPGRCVDFACRCVEGLYGFDPLPNWRDEYGLPPPERRPLEARALIWRGVDSCAARLGWEKVGRGQVRDGFIAVAFPPFSLAVGLMVVSGAKLLRTMPKGIHAMPISRAHDYWST